MPFPDQLIGWTEIIANRWLNSSGVGPFPAELTDKQVRIELESRSSRPATTLLLLIDNNGVRPLLEDAQTEPSPVDATISGTPDALLTLLLDRGGNQHPPRISGDLQLVRKLTDHLQQGDFSLETLLTDWTGPQAAYWLSQWSHHAREWLTDSGERITDNLTDYLQYETGALVNPEEWQSLTDEIAEIERRIGALQRRLTKMEKP